LSSCWIGSKSILAAPILRRDELLGVLEVFNKKGGPVFTEEDSLLLEVVANQAAVAIENARLLERIVQSEQLSVIGRMAASIIHDLKQPMAVIRGFAELLGNPDVDPEKRRTFSDLILEDVDRFLGMTQELLDYSRGTINLQPKEVQLGDWLDGVTRLLREELAGSRAEVVSQLSYRGPVWMDPDRMRRVLINIAGNARDAMSEGGTFSIVTRSGAGHWELELGDTGTGIPPELRPRIFEPFVTSGKDHGTGLGLAIVREIVEGQGGTIQLQSRVAGEEAGQSPGSVFTIRMPMGTPQTEEPQG
jgi:signal transduction histidine kinase